MKKKNFSIEMEQKKPIALWVGRKFPTEVGQNGAPIEDHVVAWVVRPAQLTSKVVLRLVEANPHENDLQNNYSNNIMDSVA
jgi:hypothetical protein